MVMYDTRTADVIRAAASVGVLELARVRSQPLPPQDGRLARRRAAARSTDTRAREAIDELVDRLAEWLRPEPRAGETVTFEPAGNLAARLRAEIVRVDVKDRPVVTVAITAELTARPVQECKRLVLKLSPSDPAVVIDSQVIRPER